RAHPGARPRSRPAPRAGRERERAGGAQRRAGPAAVAAGPARARAHPRREPRRLSPEPRPGAPGWKTARMRPGDTARLLHRLTSYVPFSDWPEPVDDPRILQDFVPNEPGTRTAQWKAYAPGLPAAALPREWPPVDAPATAVL